MDSEHRQRRSRGLKLAALTSLVCKGGNLLLQVVAIPLALVVMGEDRYGVFAAINIFVSAVLISDFGVGPGLTNILAKKMADGDADGASQAFSTSFWLVAALGAAGCLLLAGLVSFLPIERLFGARYAPYAGEMRFPIYLALAIIFARMLASVTERARAALQETFVNNLFGAIGNVVSAVVLLVGVHAFPTPWFLILAVNGGLAAAGLANAAHFFAKHPNLLPSFSAWRGSTARFLLLDGLAFCGIMSLAPLVKVLGCAQILGRIAGPGAVAVFDVLQRLNVFVYGFVVMFTFPLWPALSDAAARRDFGWIRTARQRLYGFAGLYVLAMTLGLTLAGPYAVDLWLKGKIQLGHWLLFAFCLSFAVSIWQHVHHIFLVALDDVRWVSALVLAELPLYLAAAYAGYVSAKLPGMFLAIALSGLLASLLFPFRASRKVAMLEQNSQGAPATPGNSCLVTRNT